MIYEGQRVYILGRCNGTVVESISKEESYDGNDGEPIYKVKTLADDENRPRFYFVTLLGPDCPEEEKFDDL